LSSIQTQTTTLIKRLRDFKAYMPILLTYARNAIRRKIRACVANFRKSGEGLWNWVLKEEKLDQGRRAFFKLKDPGNRRYFEL
jgi:hypothetical protein